MYTAPLAAWPRRAGHYAIILLVIVGALIFLALALGWPPAWSRSALALQALALALALLSPRLPSLRLLLYPLVLAGGIYLWDTTLPPPTLPAGSLRDLEPHVLLLCLLIDGVIAIRRARQTRWRVIQIRGRALLLDDAAALLATTPDELRRQLARAGRPVRTADDGHERLTLEDLKALLP